MISTKVLVIGLDGATFKKIILWIEKNELQFISNMIKNGVHGELEVFLPTLSPLEWACFYTGKNPGKLGIFAFSQVEDIKNPSDTKLINRTKITSPSLWKLLSDYGLKVGVVNIPATYPPEKVNGFIISGMLTPPSNKNYYYPKTLGAFLREYKIDLDYERGELPDKNIDKYALLEEQYDVTRRRIETIITLLKNFRLNFFIVNFKGIDTVQHLLWNQDSILLEFYKFVEDGIRKIYEIFKPTHIFLISDHGFHEAEKKYFYINTWLFNKGYLTKSKNVLGHIYTEIYSLGIKLARKFPIIREIMPFYFKENIISRYPKIQIDFSNTYVYASRWGLFISNKIRKSMIYQRFRDKLKNELEELRDPETGERIFNALLKRETIYKGFYLEKFPDLVFVPQPTYLINPNLTNYLTEPKIDRPYLEGQHKSDPYGIFIASGDGIKKGYKISGAKIIDIAPTILYLFNIPIPIDMDGRVLGEIFEDFLKEKMRMSSIRVKIRNRIKHLKLKHDKKYTI